MATAFAFPDPPTLDQVVTLPDGNKARWNGYAWVEVSSGAIVFPLAIAFGGTGAATAPAARVNLGLNTATGEFIADKDGTVAAPGIAFKSEPGFGFYRNASGQLHLAVGGQITHVLYAGVVGTSSIGINPRANGNAYLAMSNQAVGVANYNNLVLQIAVDGTATLTTGAAGTATRKNLLLDAPTIITSADLTVRGQAVSVGNGTSSALVVFNKANGFWNYLEARQGGLNRWQLQLGDNASETGGNVGSNFNIVRWSDAGGFLDSPLIITRSTGSVTMRHLVVTGGGNTDNSGADSINATRNVTTAGVFWQSDPNGVSNFSGGLSVAKRITGSASDVAAFYATTGGFYTEWNDLGSFRATQGGIRTAREHTFDGSVGIKVNGFSSDGTTYALSQIGFGVCNWSQGFDIRARHGYGQWAGFEFVRLEGSGQVHIVCGTDAQWGNVEAAVFAPQSDERGKEAIVTLRSQHEAFMSIAPIRWRWPCAAPKPGVPDYTDRREKWGFSAQNLSRNVPLAVYGDVNAVDAKGEPVTAGIDPVPILALTVLEVQALWAEIAALKGTP